MQKRLAPHIAAILTFAVLTIIYFLPYYQGMVLNQGDVTQWEGMSKEIVDWNKNHPNDPAMWTNSMFGGMPAFQISMVYAGNFVDKIFHVLGAIFPGPCMLLFLMFTGFYILLLCFEVDPWLSLAGSVAYGLSSFTLISIEAGHNTKVQAMTMMAPVLGSLVLAYRRNILLGGALMALFLSMCIDSNHLQITYYLFLVLGLAGVYFLIESIIDKRIANFAKATGVLIIAAILAVMPNVANLWSTQDYGKETIRGGSSELTQKKQNTDGGLDFDYASRWSEGFGDGEILSILIPNIKGGASGGALSESSATYKEMMAKGVSENQAQQYIKQMPLYWGSKPFTSGPFYFGAAIIFLFVFSLLIVQDRIKWLLVAITVFSMLLSFGHNTPFFKLVFNVLPFFNKFRTPEMALVIAQLIMPLLALLGLREIFSGKQSSDEILKKLKIAGGITAGIIILFGVLGGMFFNFSSEGDKQYYDSNNGWLIDVIKKDRASLLLADAFRSLFFVATAFALIWFFIKKKLTRSVFIAGVTLVFLIDGWSVAKRYLNSENFVDASAHEKNHSPTQADLDILKDTDPYYRVFNYTRDPFNDAMTSYFHKSVGGYHAAKLIRYQDLIENQISKNNQHVLDMLNTKYIIGQNQSTKQPMAQRNPGALGNVWFVQNIKWAKNADEEMADLTDFDPRSTVVIDQRYKNTIGNWQSSNDSAAMIRLNAYSPNKLTYDISNSSAPQLAVFSEIYYDRGWNAYIDDKKVDYFRANYVLRAIIVPPGAHKIEYRFEPQTVTEGDKIDYAGSILLFFFAFGILSFSGYKKWEELKDLPVEVKPTTPSKPAKKK